MSKIALQGDVSGTGTVTVAAPNTNTDYTLTLPTATGTISVLTVSATAPASPAAGSLWYDSTNGVMLVYYNDGTTSQWVEDYQSQIIDNVSFPDMNGGTASTTTWNYWINCGAAA